MRGIIIVETMEEYNKWLASQQPEYYSVFPEKASKKEVSDSTNKQTVQVLPVKNN